MESKRNITSYHSLEVIIQKNPGKELIEHLKKTILGTPGGLRYRHTGQEKKLESIGEVYFLLLYKMNRMLGSVGLCVRNSYNGEKTEKLWYIRYFAIHSPLRAKKGPSKTGKTKSESGAGILKTAVMPYFEDPDVLQNPKKEAISKSIIFSYIDKSNPRSLEFSENMGLEAVRDLSTLVFSRFNPHNCHYVKKISEQDRPMVLNKIRSFYSGYTMFQDRYIFFENNYYLAYENGEIVAGLQANPEEWSIIEMGGIGGMFVKLLPYIPILRKIIDPGKFRFLTLEAIFYNKGKAHYIPDIVETALATSNHNVALCWLDANSVIRRDITSVGKMGVLHMFLKPGLGEVRIRFNNYSEEEKQEYRDKPAYINAYDMS